jgi:hypothetical protein
MLTLNLGVIVQPYRAWVQRRGRGKRRPGKVLSNTTADVAHILEAEYHVMGAYYRTHKKDISAAMVNSLQGALESVLMGRRPNPWGTAMSSIESGFKKFISSREAESVGIPGTPTKAALRGVNHRLVHPYRKSNQRRPSFRDTGLYMASFKSWVDGNIKK